MAHLYPGPQHVEATSTSIKGSEPGFPARERPVFRMLDSDFGESPFYEVR